MSCLLPRLRTTLQPCASRLATRAFASTASGKITRLRGREVLDSRGNPTVEVDVYVNYHGKEQLLGRASGPSGASTGSREAKELRDKDARYMGKGVRNAVANVNNILSKAVKGMDVCDLKAVDKAIIEADGTADKSKVGGNAITAASFAIAEAGAVMAGTPLFVHLSKIFSGGAAKKLKSYTFPRPMVNILNGGKHAGGELQIQEFMIIPKGRTPFAEDLRVITEVYHHLGKILVSELNDVSAKNLGDEGGYAPKLTNPHQALTFIEKAVDKAGYKIGEDVFLALDCASSEFYSEADGKYQVEKGLFLNADEMVEYFLKLKKEHPSLISIEDPMFESDYEGWKKLTAAMTAKHPDCQLVGDDLYTTNPEYIAKGIAEKWATALLLKVNQIGTVSEGMKAAQLIFDAGQNVAVSHRSGETSNTLISDLAVGIGAQFLKTGAPARGERVAKYNRLLQISDYIADAK